MLSTVCKDFFTDTIKITTFLSGINIIQQMPHFFLYFSDMPSAAGNGYPKFIPGLFSAFLKNHLKKSNICDTIKIF